MTIVLTVALVLSNMRFFFTGKLYSQLTFKRLSFRPSFASIRLLFQIGADLHPFCPIFGRDLHPNMTKIGANLHQFGSCPKLAPICIISAPICVDSLDRIYIRSTGAKGIYFLLSESISNHLNLFLYKNTLYLLGLKMPEIRHKMII